MPWTLRKQFKNLTKRQQRNRMLRYTERCLSSLQNNLQFNQRENNILNNESRIQNVISSSNISAQNSRIQVNGDLIQPLQYIERPTNISADALNISMYDDRNVEDKIFVHNDEDKNNYIDTYENFKNLLLQYCLDMNLNHIQIRGLLRILRSHRCHSKLPKDSRTLLKTSRGKINFMSIGNVVYWHIGFIRPLQNHLLLYDDIPSALELQLNTDGLSISKSSPSTFWPIQYTVLNIPDFKPLIAGIYKGPDKPSDVNLFFQNFIDEVKQAKLLGGVLVRNERIPIMFKNFVVDAPARAMVLNHYSHNSTEPCSKCKVTGFRYENRVMAYLGIDHEKRTADEYMSRNYDDHQKGRSPLADLSINPVTQVPFEIMHLVYLGVTVRFFEGWFNGKFGFDAKLLSYLIDELSSRYVYLKHTCPSEFARRPRTLKKFGRFKATELKHFLLYASPCISVEILSEKYYFHFLLLHVAIRILTSVNQNKKLLHVAEGALKALVKYAPDLYTPAFVSYNVYGLLHFVDDARLCGPLQNCSAFIYENNMPLFKKNIRNHPRPLQQFANRLQEKSNIQHTPKKRKSKVVAVEHSAGPIPHNFQTINYKQYKKYLSSTFEIELGNSDSYSLLEDKSIVKIENILKVDEKILLVVRKFQNVDDFYEKPIK